MTPPLAEFKAALTREGDRRQKERCVKRKAGEQIYSGYRNEVFERQYRRYDKCKRP